MQVTLEQTDRAGTMVVRIAGRATVRFADQLKATLVEALSAAAEVVLDLGGVTEFDAAFLQLLCAAQKSAAATNKLFHPGAGCPESLATEFAEAGFPLPHAVIFGHGGDTR